MKKLSKYIIVLALLCLVTGCGKKEIADTDQVSTIKVEKKGAVEGTIIEDFDEPYYDEKELEEKIDQTISEYNGTAGKNHVELKECKKIENAVSVVIRYETSEDYKDFNHVDFFYGTISEAYDAGYDLNLTLTEVKSGAKAGKEDLMAMGDKHIVITSEQERISCYDNILYTGDGMTIVNDKEADNTNSEGYGIIIF